MRAKQQQVGADRPSRVDRVVSEIAWYTPEIAAGTVAAMAGAAVWSPLALVSAVAGGLIVVDRVRVVRSNRAAKAKAAAMRAEKQRERAAAEVADSCEEPETGADRWEVSA